MRRFLCLLLALVQVLPSLGAVAPRHSDSRPQYGPVGMSYGVVTSENHDYLVDTSQPYAEVIQEKTWLTDGAGKPLDGNALIYRYDIGLDRLHYFKYQMPINGPPSLGSPVLSEWLLFDGLGSTRIAGRILAHLALERSSDLLQLSLVTRRPFPYPPEPLRGMAVSAVTRALRRVDAGEAPSLMLRVLDRLGIGFSS